ncbi:4'-phosphopantetheinyl transferase superfamily protein [Leuconostoc gasicomitatum]|uniref:4'-phosphopantetheinyl transferase superfamily protein n=1 Tax=Leuconostoc gasicomitatum TaxID=115778 RepID=UPI003AB52879
MKDKIILLQTILTETERSQAAKRKGKHYNEFIAGRFSAKEAFRRQQDMALVKKVHWHDIEILNAPNGRPIMRVKKFCTRHM